MAPVRLRHPNGVSSIEVSFEPEFTVQDLQQEIYATTQILPSRQILKAGYPPRSLTLVPELPIQSLGLQRGDQIFVSEAAEAASPARVQSIPQTQSIPAQPIPASASVPAQRSAPTQRSAPGPTPRSPPAQSSGPDSVEVDGGFLVHRVVPDDNSCLFSSAALVFEQSISKAPQMRKVVADGIRNNPETYTEGILGMPPPQYITTISKPTTWGGAIELAILATHYSAEIASIDVETGRIDHFTPGEYGSASTGMRAIFIYSGIHYDAASLAPMVDAPSEWHQTLFPIQSPDDSSDPILIAAKKLADILRSKKAFTNTATFDLKCEQCGQGLKGEKGARAHAEQTGHVRFGEY
ncbi:hypothetical protein GALMADRAFT_251204 [Galerina marginata CBS 339.88]|uniref:Ubiquitin thioesterase OTU n=1 Tax=Galerina marginata (strain CBS 339.88) TaxID=685588 RepID=A0A067SRE6_GALM3|nr:hypothetical protein GALMADRAFT_251204 [Galerina marginata CBS 339.88]